MSKKVFIGVGHGGTDSGAVKYIIEKEYTLKTAFAGHSGSSERYPGPSAFP